MLIPARGIEQARARGHERRRSGRRPGGVRARIGAVLVAGALFGVGCDQCRDTVVAKLPSPDSQRQLYIFSRTCSSTNDFSTQVSILNSGETPRGAGNVLIANTDRGRAPSASWGGPQVEAVWLSPRRVQIRYDSRARVYARKSNVGGVAIEYVAVSG